MWRLDERGADTVNWRRGLMMRRAAARRRGEANGKLGRVPFWAGHEDIGWLAATVLPWPKPTWKVANVTKDSNMPESGEGSTGGSTTPKSSAVRGQKRFTRAGALWVATGVALLLLVLLIVFMLQNSTSVEVHFLGWDGTIPVGLALLIAAVSGGVLVALAGIARVTQLRINARRLRRDEPGA